MDRVLFTRIGWMKRYRGPAVDDARPIEGGAYTESELGYEAFNFLPIRGRLYGFFEPPSPLRSLNLERIEPGFPGDTLTGVHVVFTATHPTLGGQRIVGWYRNATVYRNEQPSSDDERQRFEYLASASSDDGVLVEETQRTFPVPAGKGGFGQANVCYALEDDGTKKPGASCIDDALQYIAKYRE
jgi:hypothetical protein